MEMMIDSTMLILDRVK